MLVPISVSDILKILDQIPIWKAVANLPRRVAELETKVAALEAIAGRAPPALTGRECAICGTPMRVTSETPDPTFGALGVKTHHMECAECGATTDRQFEPGKGYL